MQAPQAPRMEFYLNASNLGALICNSPASIALWSSTLGDNFSGLFAESFFPMPSFYSQLLAVAEIINSMHRTVDISDL